MSILGERIKGHFSTLPRQELLIPEWGTPAVPGEGDEPGQPAKPLKVTWTPRTAAERRQITRPEDNGFPALPVTMFVRAILLKACDENGALLFTDMADEEMLLTKADDAVVCRLGTMIIYGGAKPKSGGEQVDDAKNG